MRLFLRVWAILVVAIKRLFSQRWLALATALGLVTSVALVMSIPLYADAVYHRLLLGEVVGILPDEAGTAGDSAPGSGNHPPFAFMFRYVGAWAGAVEWEDMLPVDAYLTERASAQLGLPQKELVRYFKTDNYQLFPQGAVEDISYANNKDSLAWVSFAFVSDLVDHIDIQEGRFPEVASPASGSTIEVLVHEDLATELGLQVGEMYQGFARRTTDEGPQKLQVPVRIAGVWQARDPEEEYWFYNPKALTDELLVPEETFVGRVSPYDDVYLGMWYLLLDGSDITHTDATPLLIRITSVRQQAASLLPDTRLDVSPVAPLQQYRESAGLLTVMLYAFSVPIVGLILAFIGLVVGLTVGRQRNEIAVLRSRGATTVQVIGIAVLEGLLLGLIALTVGSPVGSGVAYVIGKARSFLDFSLPSELNVGVTIGTLRFGIAAIVLALVAQVAPTISAARHTIVTYKQEQARTLRRPWWQRAWLDVLLLIPAAYGFYMLRQQESIVAPVTGNEMIGDPFQNPLLFLVPALGIFALTLLILRVLPLIMAGVAWVASRVGSVGVLLAARHLSRTPGFYVAPMLLLVLTLSLSGFTASLAQTLDHHLYDQMYYRYGSDLSMVELGEDTEQFGGMGFFGDAAGEGDEEDEEDAGPRWLFLPVSEHLKVPGVQGAARVGRYRATSRLSGGAQEGVFLGVDYHDFSQVAFWRSDFARVSLGQLMNALAVQPDGVLVHRELLARHALGIGDTFRLSVHTYGQTTEMDVKIVGTFDLFPSWYPYPDDGEYEPLFVGNLEHLFERAGGQFPYHVWLNTAADANPEEIIAGVRDLRLGVTSWHAPLALVAEEQRRPERQGLFGVLSVGFVAAALLTVLGFLLYAFFSFRRRFIELGVLRAVGLSSGQMTAFLAWELALLILVGLVAGTGLGVWVSELFIPFLQVGTEVEAQVPPFVVEIAWPAITRIYVLFGLLFFAALAGLTALLMRMKIFQAVKLGETV